MNQNRMHSMWKQFGGMVIESWGARGRPAGNSHVPLHNSMTEADRQLEEFMIQHRHWQDLSVPEGY